MLKCFPNCIARIYRELVVNFLFCGLRAIFYEMARLSAFITKTILMTPSLFVRLGSMFCCLLSMIDLFSGDFIGFTNYWMAWFMLWVLHLMRGVLCLRSLWDLFPFCRWIWTFVVKYYSILLFLCWCCFRYFLKMAWYALDRCLWAYCICLLFSDQWICFYW